MFDRNRSGSIELHEFQALWSYIGQWRQVFDQYDRDRSGAIDGSELQNSKFTFCYVLCVLIFLCTDYFIEIVVMYLSFACFALY